jgi:hypothetical protein
MRVESVMAANAAMVGGGLLNVQGGGWEHYNTPGYFPCTVAGTVAGIVVLDADELGTTPDLNVAIDADGQDVGYRASMIIDASRPPPTTGVPCRFPFAVPFMFIATAPAVVRDPVPDVPQQ